MILLLLASAFAAEVDRYPWQARVNLPDCAGCDQGVWRVRLPPPLRSVDDPVDGTDLTLLDSNGDPVPFAIARGQGEARTTWIRVQPTGERDVYRIEAMDRPIDGLSVELPTTPSVATVSVFRSEANRWVPHGQPQLVWRHADGDRTEVDFPVTSGPLLVRLQYTDRGPLDDPDIDGFTRPLPDVPPSQLDLPVTDWRLEEDGWARYTVKLPHPLPVRAVTLNATDPLFDREVVVGDKVAEGWQRESATGRIRRFHIGGASVDLLRVPTPGRNETDALVIYVEARGDAPLTIPDITVEVEGSELLLLDPGPGPFTLLAGAPPQTGLTYDLVVAVPELAREAQGVVDPTDISDNPAYRPPELRTGLVAPGPPADLARQRWSRPVQGSPGLARIPLDREALAHVQADHRDLRLVDAEGRRDRRCPADRGAQRSRDRLHSLGEGPAQGRLASCSREQSDLCPARRAAWHWPPCSSRGRCRVAPRRA